MKKYLFFSFLFLSLFAFSDETPKLVCLEPLKDFGLVVKGEELFHSFEIKNEGKADLTIIDVRPSCGCTVAEADKVIKPGQKGKIKTKLETKDFKGPITKDITVVSNDPENPQLKLFLKAIIRPVVEVLPDSNLRFVKLRKDVGKVQRLLVTEEEGFEFKILNYESSKPYIKFEYTPAPQDKINPQYKNKQYEITALIGPEAPVGMVNEKLTVFTNSKLVPKIELKIIGLVRPEIQITPPKLELGTIDATSDFQRMIRVKDNSGSKKFELISVQPTVPFITVSQEVIKPGEDYNLNIMFSKEPPKGNFEGKVVIKTNSEIEEYKNIEIPISGIIK